MESNLFTMPDGFLDKIAENTASATVRIDHKRRIVGGTVLSILVIAVTAISLTFSHISSEEEFMATYYDEMMADLYENDIFLNNINF